MTRGQNADGVWQRFEYDAAGRLKRVTDDAGNWLEDNAYGASRQRVFRNSGEFTWYVWGGDSVLAEYTSTAWGGAYTWAKSYIYAGSRLLFTATNNGAGGELKEYHHPDRLGTRMVTDPAANTLYLQSTLPFGTQFDSETTGSSNSLFTSYDRSAATGLDNAVNRTYSPGQGRFTTADPIGMASTSLGNPQSFNLFAYVQNNPIDFVDPSGLNLDSPGTTYGESGFLWRLWYGNINDGYTLVAQFFIPNSGNSGNGGGVDDGGSGSTSSDGDEVGLQCPKPANVLSFPATSGLRHYTEGSGTPVTISIGEVQATPPQPFDFPSVLKAYNSGAGTYTITNQHSNPVTVNGWQAAVLGRITFAITGVLNVGTDGQFTFSGSIGAIPDVYDFDASSRGIIGEASTLVGSLIPGEPYTINFSGAFRVTYFSNNDGSVTSSCTR